MSITSPQKYIPGEMRDSRVLAITSSVLTPPAVTTARSYPTYPSISKIHSFRHLAIVGRLIHTLVSVRPLRSRVIMPGLHAVNAGMSSQGMSLPSRMRHFSFSLTPRLRGSLSICAQRSLTREVSSVRLTPDLRSTDSFTREPFTSALTAFLLI